MKGKAMKGKKGKGKAKAKGRKGLKALPAPVVDGAEAPTGQGEPKPRDKTASIRKKVMAALGAKGLSIDEGIAEAKAALRTVDAEIEEAVAMEEAQGAAAVEAKNEYEQAKKDAEDAMEKEKETAAHHRAIEAQKQEQVSKIARTRKQVLDEQMKLAMLEVMAVNISKMQELEKRRQAAAQAADEAKRIMTEQRQREKDALEATRKALAEARGKGAGKAGKRASADNAEDGASSKRAAMHADSVATTLADTVAEVPEDID